MKTFFRDEMVVRDPDLTIPSHEKTLCLMKALRRRDDVQWVDDFEPLSWEKWGDTHDPDFLRSVASADLVIFDAASVPTSNEMVHSISFCAASIIEAASAALQHGCAFSPTAGFHHAHWACPGPFCVLNALPLTAFLNVIPSTAF